MRISVGPVHSMLTDGCCFPGATSKEGAVFAAGRTAISVLAPNCGGETPSAPGSRFGCAGAGFDDGSNTGSGGRAFVSGCGKKIGAGSGAGAFDSGCPSTDCPRKKAANPVPETANSDQQNMRFIGPPP